MVQSCFNTDRVFSYEAGGKRYNTDGLNVQHINISNSISNFRMKTMKTQALQEDHTLIGLSLHLQPAINAVVMITERATERRWNFLHGLLGWRFG